MSKLVTTFRKDFPEYFDLINNKEKENPEQSTARLLERINKYNGG